ncbi:ArsR/SmtB family transcription factor [Yoonia sp. R2331]|uniref:ArsR/SmtB family transcription factor n=1 Tax=Yoonia sp. R2331 TaxID=3237238 RepID=UPI0034E59037
MTMDIKVSVDPMTAAADEAAELMKSLSNPARLRLLCALVPQDRGVSELVALLGASQSYVSGQLLRLRAEGLVTCHKNGRSVRYQLSDPRVRPVLERLYEVFCPAD